MAQPGTTPELKPPVTEHDHTYGNAGAPVTLVEYGDYQCPHCRQVQPIVRDLRERFGDRLRYVFRHFPINTLHPRAQKAAEAAEAAAAQGKFWQMHDLLYDHQDALEDDDLVRYAAELGLDVERFERELRTGVYTERVREDFMSGVRSGANGTPSFFINGYRYDGPWDLDSLVAEIEKPLGVRVRVMFRQFTRLQASGGIILLAATLLALVWANTAFAAGYFSLWETRLSITLADFLLSEDFLHWINDGLMVVFFFVVGLEIKREVLVGELASPKRAALPVMAAVGGMVLPALFYAAFNAGGDGAAGWGVPVATDIAFTLGLLTVLGRRVPTSLKVFFTALAIADDLGAVLVIAIFYSGEIQLAALAVGGGLLLVLILMNRLSVRNPLPYALFGIGLWLAFLESGVHPTIAGILLAMTIPARTYVRASAFTAQCTATLGGLGRDEPADEEGAAVGRQQAAAQTLEAIAERLQSPLQRLERTLTPWTTYLIIPLFALANAGVALSGDIGATLVNPISLGIILGLVLGKSLGITLFSWLAVRLGIAEMPTGVGWRRLFGASWLAGIGFTMSLYIASSAFDDPALLDTAKVGILVASLLAAVIGIFFLTSAGSIEKKIEVTEYEGT
jgi:NhaA family Na+:H+ antiporter